MNVFDDCFIVWKISDVFIALVVWQAKLFLDCFTDYDLIITIVRNMDSIADMIIEGVEPGPLLKR